MKCKQCGTENKPDALICDQCGFVLDNDDAMFSSNEQTIDAEASHRQSQIDEIKKRRDAKRRRKKIQKIVLLILIILLSAGAIWGAFYLSEQQDIKIDDNPITQVSPTPTQAPTPSPTPVTTAMPTPEASETPLQTDNALTPQATQDNAPAATTPVSTPTPEVTNTPTQATKAPVQSTPKPTKKPTLNPPLKSVLVSVGSAVTASGKSYIPAYVNGKTVYLKTAELVEANSHALVSATDTGVKVDNIPVYSVWGLAPVNKEEFILPDSSTRLLTEADIAGMSVEQIKLARNEIYARHGRKFKDEALNSYFSSKAWYKVNSSYKYNNDALNVNDIENKNAHFLLSAEQALTTQ